jgi:hypothetical protein
MNVQDFHIGMKKIRIYLGLKFKRIGRIKLKKDKNNKIINYRPQGRYNNIRKIPLNRYGKGSFCYFSIPSSWVDKAGIYLFLIRNQIKYIGECDDLFYRVYDYGNISPRKCFDRGQSTNCKINKLILRNFKRGINLWFYNTDKMSIRKRRRIEKKLISTLHPTWNGGIKI